MATSSPKRFQTPFKERKSAEIRWRQGKPIETYEVKNNKDIEGRNNEEEGIGMRGKNGNDKLPMCY